MANREIGQLPADLGAQTGDLYAIERAGVNYKQTIDEVATFTLSGIASLAAAAALGGTDVYLTLQSGVPVKTTLAAIATFVNAQSGSGDVTGPGSSTSNGIALWNGTSGKVLQNSNIVIDGSSNITGVASITSQSATVQQVSAGGNVPFAITNTSSVAGSTASATITTNSTGTGLLGGSIYWRSIQNGFQSWAHGIWATADGGDNAYHFSADGTYGSGDPLILTSLGATINGLLTINVGNVVVNGGNVNMTGGNIINAAGILAEAGSPLALSTLNAVSPSGITLVAGNATGGNNNGASIAINPGSGNGTGVAGLINIGGRVAYAGFQNYGANESFETVTGAAYTLTSNDINKSKYFTFSGAVTVTVPASGTFTRGFNCKLYAAAGTTVTISLASGGDSILASPATLNPTESGYLVLRTGTTIYELDPLFDLNTNAPVNFAGLVFLDSVNGSDSNNGQNSWNPVLTMAHAVSLCGNGYAIIIAPGSYFPTFAVSVEREIMIMSEMISSQQGVFGAASAQPTLGGTFTLDCDGNGTHIGQVYFKNITFGGTNSVDAPFVVLNNSNPLSGTVSAVFDRCYVNLQTTGAVPAATVISAVKNINGTIQWINGSFGNITRNDSAVSGVGTVIYCTGTQSFNVNIANSTLQVTHLDDSFNSYSIYTDNTSTTAGVISTDNIVNNISVTSNLNGAHFIGSIGSTTLINIPNTSLLLNQDVAATPTVTIFMTNNSADISAPNMYCDYGSTNGIPFANSRVVMANVANAGDVINITGFFATSGNYTPTKTGTGTVNYTLINGSMGIVSTGPIAGLGTVTSITASGGVAVTGGGAITSTGNLVLAPIADGDLLANTGGSPLAPIATTLTALFNYIFGSQQGMIPYRNGTVWTNLPAGTGYLTGTGAGNPLTYTAPVAYGAGSGNITTTRVLSVNDNTKVFGIIINGATYNITLPNPASSTGVLYTFYIGGVDGANTVTITTGAQDILGNMMADDGASFINATNIILGIGAPLGCAITMQSTGLKWMTSINNIGVTATITFT